MKLFSTLLILTMFSCKMKGLEKTAGIESYIVSELVQCDTTLINTTVITIVGGGCGDGQTKGAAVFNPAGEYDTSGLIIKHYKYDSAFFSLVEEPLGGESGFLMHQRDTIMTSDLDLSVTYSDTKKNFIIYKGEVFFRADVVGEEKRAKAVLDRFKEMQDRVNEKLNPQYLKNQR